MSDKIELNFATPEGVVIYPNVFEPRAYEEVKNGKKVVGKPRYSTKLVIDEIPDALLEQVQAAGVAIFRDKHQLTLEPHEVPVPWQKGDQLIAIAKRKNKPLKEPLAELYKGRFVFSASTGEDMAPEIMDVNERSLVPVQGEMSEVEYKTALAAAKKRVFSGTKGHLVGRLNFMLDQTTADPRCTCYFNALMVVPGGVEIKGLSTGGASASELLKKVRGRTSMADPTEGMDPEDF